MNVKRNIYLRTIPIPEALALVKGALERGKLVGVESVPVEEALGRITAKPVMARLSSPTYHCAAMDGIAVKAETTYLAREGSPVTLLPGTGFGMVNTGQPLPKGMGVFIFRFEEPSTLGLVGSEPSLTPEGKMPVVFRRNVLNYSVLP